MRDTARAAPIAPPPQLTRTYLEAKVREALDEDLGPRRRDVTTEAVVPPGLQAESSLVVRAEGVVAGLPVAAEVFRQVDARIVFEPAAADGDRVRPGDVIARASGPLQGLLRAERTALNFLQQLSGVATLTRRYADAAGTAPAVLDTRKTVPGLRRELSPAGGSSRRAGAPGRGPPAGEGAQRADPRPQLPGPGGPGRRGRGGRLARPLQGGG